MVYDIVTGILRDLLRGFLWLLFFVNIFALFYNIVILVETDFEYLGLTILFPGFRFLQMICWVFNDISGWWWLDHFLFFHSVGNVIIPIDALIFFRGVGLNHQPNLYIDRYMCRIYIYIYKKMMINYVEWSIYSWDFCWNLAQNPHWGSTKKLLHGSNGSNGSRTFLESEVERRVERWDRSQCDGKV